MRLQGALRAATSVTGLIMKTSLGVRVLRSYGSISDRNTVPPSLSSFNFSALLHTHLTYMLPHYCSATVRAGRTRICVTLS